MSGRGLTAGMITATSTGVVRPIRLVDLDFQSGALRMWTGNGSLSWDFKTWLGAGQLLSFEKIGENSSIQAIGTAVVISGIPSANLSLILGETYRGRAATIYLGCVKSSDLSIVADPVVLFSGFMDDMPIDDGPETATINIKLENKLIALESPKNKKYTNEGILADDATDKAGEYISGLQNKPIIFGK